MQILAYFGAKLSYTAILYYCMQNVIYLYTKTAPSAIATWELNMQGTSYT